MRWIYALAVLSLLSVAPAYADMDRGEAAFERGDFATALDVFRPLAASGDAEAQHFLGVMYYRGKGVAQDFAEAAKQFRAAAEQGHARAQSLLAEMYAAGEGVARSHETAAAWYQKAAAQGHEVAQTALSFMYTEGRGVERDFVQALKWNAIVGQQNQMIAVMFRNHLTYRMNEEEIAEADRLAREWKPTP